MRSRAALAFVIPFAAFACTPAKEPSPTALATASPVVAARGDDDPTKTDGDKYVAIFENDRVRVLRYRDKPGDKTKAHRHPDSFVYAVTSFRRRLTFPDGKTRELDLKAGDSMWLPAQGHIGENIGATDTEVLLFEPKH